MQGDQSPKGELIGNFQVTFEKENRGSDNMKKALSGLLIGSFLAALNFGSPRAYRGPEFIQEATTHGIRCLAGGVALEERSRLEKMAKDCNLKLVFALLSGEYLADIKVEIQDNTKDPRQ